ncbi:MAG: ATP-binding protein [Muribaculaceae bacterium]|nr:ATP-binding protein [Muribaculaceae bacterium]
MRNLKYPIGIQNFARLREDGYIYVDKTRYIHELVSSGKYYFLSRPRRFGKSLLLSTIEAFYQGRRELFNGLAIDCAGHNWVERPVLHLDFTARLYRSHNDVASAFNEFFAGLEESHHIDKSSDDPGERFGNIIREIHHKSGKRVVILIDEYDKPLLDTVGLQDIHNEYRSVLKAVYGNLKKNDAHIEFAMLTGVTKFGKLSVFSDLNNLNDISFDDEYAAICGVTEEELRMCFTEGVHRLAAKMEIPVPEAFAELKRNYDGYHFAACSPDVYNPFSLLNCLSKRSIGEYWFATGTPTFLVKMIKSGQLQIRDLSDYPTALTSLYNVSLSLNDLIPVLYQSGYLTIKGFDPKFRNIAILGYPNREVENGFLNELLAVYTPLNRDTTEFTITRFVNDVDNGMADSFMQRLQSLFSGYQYDQMELGNLELHYRNVVYLVMRMMGFYTRAEMQTANGRIDLTVQTDRYLYLFEFKLDGSAREALNQIDSRGYPTPFKADGRRIIKIGANFSSSLRSIESWIVES